jgi:hypothetical protein
VTQDLAAIRLARHLVATGQARAVREAAGVSRAEAVRGRDFTIDALTLWERGQRMPRGSTAAAYGELLRELMSPVGT